MTPPGVLVANTLTVNVTAALKTPPITSQMKMKPSWNI